MQEMALIVNLTAGYGRCRLKYPEVTAYLEQNKRKAKRFFTERRGHGEELARQAVREGFAVIVAVGGDGTLNEVVNGVAGSQVTLGYIPAGSGNDFGRILGLKKGEVIQACHVLEDGHVRAVDLCRSNGRFFINVAGAGFDAEVVRMANIWGKRFFSGAGAYVASILRQIAVFAPREMVIEIDDQRICTKAWMVAAANGRYIGGGLMVAPTAQIDDELLDVYIVRETSKVELLMVLPRVFTGGHVSHPAVTFHRAKRVRISSPHPLAVQADGEIIGHLPQQFEVTGEKINMILPNGGVNSVGGRA